MRRDVRTHARWSATSVTLVAIIAVVTPRAQAPAPAQPPKEGFIFVYRSGARVSSITVMVQQ